VTLALRPLRPGGTDYAAFLHSLTTAGLPTDDLDGGGRYFALQGHRGPVAFGGLEGSGPDQMIRSVIVPLSSRGRGYGHEVARRLVEQAKADRAERLWLLTTSADRFFAALGWRAADRAAAPGAVRTSDQFARLCPSSAVLMCRPLA
jgi:N-acetylglutamate synthase-like GNAT family acetyltransferase